MDRRQIISIKNSFDATLICLIIVKKGEHIDTKELQTLVTKTQIENDGNEYELCKIIIGTYLEKIDNVIFENDNVDTIWY